MYEFLGMTTLAFAFTIAVIINALSVGTLCYAVQIDRSALRPVSYFRKSVQVTILGNLLSFFIISIYCLFFHVWSDKQQIVILFIVNFCLAASITGILAQIYAKIHIRKSALSSFLLIFFFCTVTSFFPFSLIFMLYFH